MRIAVFGAGAWGTAVALHLAARHEVKLWARDAGLVDALRRDHENARYLPGVALPAALQFSADLDDTCRWLADGMALGQPALAVIGTSVAGLRPMLSALDARLPAGVGAAGEGAAGVNVASEGAAACVVIASEGYPGSYPKGKEITGIEQAESREEGIVFHAGTAMRDAALVTNGGRVLGVTAINQQGNLADAVRHAYHAVEQISFDGAFYRSDIGHRAVGGGHRA